MSEAEIGVRIRETLGDIDPLTKVPFKRAKSRVKKGLVPGVSLILPRIPWRGSSEKFRVFLSGFCWVGV